LNAKIQRVCKEIEKSKEKINTEQARLKDLERQKTELENLDIVNTVRGMNISFADLAALLKQANASTPTVGNATATTSGQHVPKLNELAASAENEPTTAETSTNNDNDEEDME